MRSAFKVKFEEYGKGRDGGFGKVKSFNCTAASSKAARRKFKKRGRIISIRKI